MSQERTNRNRGRSDEPAELRIQEDLIAAAKAEQLQRRRAYAQAQQEHVWSVDARRYLKGCGSFWKPGAAGMWKAKDEPEDVAADRTGLWGGKETMQRSARAWIDLWGESVEPVRRTVPIARLESLQFSSSAPKIAQRLYIGLLTAPDAVAQSGHLQRELVRLRDEIGPHVWSEMQAFFVKAASLVERKPPARQAFPESELGRHYNETTVAGTEVGQKSEQEVPMHLTLDTARTVAILGSRVFDLRASGFEFLRVLHKADGAWIPGIKMREKVSNPSRTKNELPPEIGQLIESGNSGYRIAPRFVRPAASGDA